MDGFQFRMLRHFPEKVDYFLFAVFRHFVTENQHFDIGFTGKIFCFFKINLLNRRENVKIVLQSGRIFIAFPAGHDDKGRFKFKTARIFIGKINHR